MKKSVKFENPSLVTAKSIPIVKLQNTISRKLGDPYTNCSNNQFLQYMPVYTEGHCIFECKIKQILTACKCSAPFFPDTVDRSIYPDCTVYDHITCVKNQLIKFKTRAACKCQKDCTHSEVWLSAMLKLNEVQPVATQIQYGHKFTMEHEETHNNRYLSLCAKTSQIVVLLAIE